MLGSCGPGAVPWIEQLFGDCVYNARDLVGFSFGMASICCWLVAQMPQLYRNYKTKSAEALSPWFLAEWLLGDTFNLLGALLKGDQLPTVVFTAQYFICVDAVMMVQYMYYISLQRRRERIAAARRHRPHHRHHHHGSGQRRHTLLQHGSGDEPEGEQQQQQQHGSGGEGGSDRGGRGPHAAVDDPVAVVVSGSGGGSSAEIRPGSANATGSSAGRSVPVVAAGGRDVAFRPQRLLLGLGTLLLLAYVPHHQPWQLSGQQQDVQLPMHRQLLMAALGGSGSTGWFAHLPHWTYTAGTVLGYCSSALYLTSRLSQIWKNHSRQSTEGLAISMFMCAMAANTCYGSSILIRSYTWPELRSSLPWLIGSLGTVALDLAIYLQWRLLGQPLHKQHPSDEDEPLLPPA